MNPQSITSQPRSFELEDLHLVDLSSTYICIHKAISTPTTERKSRKISHLTNTHDVPQFLADHFKREPINEPQPARIPIMTSNLHFCEIAFLRHLVLYAHTLIIRRDTPLNYY